MKAVFRFLSTGVLFGLVFLSAWTVLAGPLFFTDTTYTGPDSDRYLRDTVSQLLSEGLKGAGFEFVNKAGAEADSVSSSVIAIEDHLRVSATLAASGGGVRFQGSETFKRGKDILPRLDQWVSQWVKGAKAAALPASAPPVAVSSQTAPKEERATAREADRAPLSTKTDEAKPASPLSSARTSPPLEAAASAVWRSQRLPFPFRSVAFGVARRGEGPEFVAASSDRISIFRREGDALKLVADYPSPYKEEELIRIDIFDLNGDGVGEILATAFHYEQVRSFALEWQGEGKWNRLVKDLKYVWGVRELGGRKIVVGQKKHYKDKFQGPLFALTYTGGQIQAKEIEGLPGDLDLFGSQWFDLSDADQDRILSLKESGLLHLYDKRGDAWHRRWTSGDKYGGETEYVDVVHKSVLNEVMGEHLFFLPDIQVAHDGAREVVLFRNEDYLKGVVGKVPSIKWSKVYRLAWSDLGFKPIWESEQFDGKIPDLKLADVDQDGREDIVFVLDLRDKGYFDGLNPRKDSIISVISR